MKVLVIGQGGREHALCWKLKQSAKVTEVFCAPGNPGISKVATLVPIAVDKCEDLAAFAKENEIVLTVVGPEYPLTLGLTDIFRGAGLRVFGPSKAAAALEGSKSFAKEIMQGAGVPTAAYETFEDEGECRAYVEKRGAPIVLKIDGLAAGKGVFVCQTDEEAQNAVTQLFNNFGAKQVVVEDFLNGVEASFIVATDGKRIFPFVSSHDYKRIRDNDEGPNTGGMGTVAPTPRLTAEQADWAVAHVMEPVIKQMSAKGVPFAGFLYAGLMIAEDGSVNVLEFNARMGDPEGQVILSQMESDLFAVLFSLSGSEEASEALPQAAWSEGASVCVVLASEGYPEAPVKGDPIAGVEEAEGLPGVVVFQAGTSTSNEGELITSGGRVLNVTATGASVAEARSRAYEAAELINFRGRQFRGDIAA